MKAWFAKYWKWLALAALLVALSAAWSFLPLGEWIKSFTAWVEKLGPLGVVVFVAIYAVATVLFLPGSLLTISKPPSVSRDNRPPTQMTPCRSSTMAWIGSVNGFPSR